MGIRKVIGKQLLILAIIAGVSGMADASGGTTHNEYAGAAQRDRQRYARAAKRATPALPPPFSLTPLGHFDRIVARKGLVRLPLTISPTMAGESREIHRHRRPGF